MAPPRIAEHPRPDHIIWHLSDTHLVGGSGLLYGDVDSEARLRQIFAELEHSHVRPEALVFTGDLADKGEPDAYRKLREIVGPAAAALGAQVIWAMGNHDDRASFRSGLLGEPGTANPVHDSYDVNGLRVITVDSTVPGEHYGLIEDSELEWLARELSVPAPHGTILALHHPPVPSVLDPAVIVELREQRALAEVLAGTDVRTILAGHLHYSTSAMFARIPVSVASATCYTQDLNVPSGGGRGRDGAQGYNLVHVYEETIVHSVVPIGTYPTVGEYVSPAESARRLRAEGIIIPDAASAPLVSPEFAPERAAVFA